MSQLISLIQIYVPTVRANAFACPASKKKNRFIKYTRIHYRNVILKMNISKATPLPFHFRQRIQKKNLFLNAVGNVYSNMHIEAIKNGIYKFPAVW